MIFQASGDLTFAFVSASSRRWTVSKINILTVISIAAWEIGEADSSASQAMGIKMSSDEGFLYANGGFGNWDENSYHAIVVFKNDATLSRQMSIYVSQNQDP